MEKATFGAGCFWHVEEAFRHLSGVISTQVGYSGGTKDNPTYREVCTGTTGHAESVELVYDSSKISYDRLLEVFWDNHDPTTLDRQGPDVGHQYRSVIFYHNEEQHKKALESKERLERSGRNRGRKVVTEIVTAGKFYRAEEYHQQYFEKHGLTSCKVSH